LCALISDGIESAAVQAALDTVNPGTPHYRQIRNFTLIPMFFAREWSAHCQRQNFGGTPSMRDMLRKSRPCTIQKWGARPPASSTHEIIHRQNGALGMAESVIELTLDHAPANEIGTAMLAELEKFVAAFDVLAPETSVCIIASARKSVFSAGGDLRELYATAAAVPRRTPRRRGALFWNVSTPF